MYKIFTKQLVTPKWYILKLLLIMRLTTTIILLSMLQVSAASFGQNITYIKKDATLIQLFKEIKAQTGYNVVWSEESIDPTTRIDVNFRNTPLQEALDKSFKSLPLAYVINDKTIVIKEKTPSFRDKIVDYFTAIDVTGTVYDDKGNPLSGATVKVEGTDIVVRTNDKGGFTLNSKADNGVLIISFLGYKTEKVSFSPGKPGLFNIVLKQEESGLKEIEIVSTGYQNIPKERASGAFTLIDNKTINRSTDINILNRLQGLASGVLINRGLERAANNSIVSIRGRSTIFANASPLIVLDGFPYEGTIDQINPSDIETISILKDAAAASIWGTRASNGVIVLTSKKGRKNQKLAIDISSTLTISTKPDLHYLPQVSSSDYINLEQFLFNQGYYNSSINLKYFPISLAVEVMNKKKMGLITAVDSANQINAMKEHDVRADLDKYLYREKIYQQYQLNISGGSDNNNYYISGGYDKNLESTVTENYDRLTISARNNISLMKGKLEISGDFNLSTSNTNRKSNRYLPYRPYDMLVDNQGNSLPVVNNFRVSYVDTAGNGKLLDWHYRPKDEFIPNQHDEKTQYKFQLGLNYNILDGLFASTNYQYLDENGDNQTNHDLNSYYTRDFTNRFSSISDNVVNTAFPTGNIVNNLASKLNSKIARFQLSYSKVIKKDHELNAIAGYEVNDSRINTNDQTLYGYNPDNLTNANNTINPLKRYRLYFRPSSQLIPTAPTSNNLVNFTQSYYGNFSYIYKGRYILSGSTRKDESNLFGVNANQKGVPLWSTGFAWNIERENFYHIDWLSSLKVRITYGYNGNIDKTLSGLLTTQNYGFTNRWGSVYSTILNPPNPALSWEKVKTWNFGLDFSLKNNRINGSFDIYKKTAVDLIGNSPISIQSGVQQFKGNSADLQIKGIDLIINSKNLVGIFQWNTNFLLNYNTDKVTNYKIKQSSNYDIVSGNYNNPLEGYPYYSIFSFPSAGLDKNGSPQGFLNGLISQDYSSIMYSLNPGSIKYHGSGSPKYFGSILNSFYFKGFDLSLNVLYKLNYYFRRTNSFTGSNYLFKVSDYERRWQKSGDELTTKTPSLIYPSDTFRDTFFQFSQDLVERGDHVRLQDIKFSYQMSISNLKNTPFKKAVFFTYAQNLGILWRKNAINIDPDYGSSIIPQPFSISVGVNLTL